MTVDIQQHAEDNLRFIRDAMARAERVSAVSGAGAMVMGLVALVTMTVSAGTADAGMRLLVWIGAAFVAGAMGALACW